jgi:hypothetical protein
MQPLYACKDFSSPVESKETGYEASTSPAEANTLARDSLHAQHAFEDPLGGG